MRHLVKVAAIAAGMIVFSGVGFAQQCKIAVINMQDAVVNSNDGKSKSALFDARVADWKKKIDAIQAAIDEAQTKLKNQSSIASASVINDLNKTISDKQKELQRTTEDAEKDVNEYRGQLLDPVMKVADDIKQELSSEKNFDIVYDISAEGSTIIYVDKRCDMTEEVKKRMNAKAGTPAPAAKPNPPKPPDNKPPQNPPPGGRGGNPTGTNK